YESSATRTMSSSSSTASSFRAQFTSAPTRAHSSAHMSSGCPRAAHSLAQRTRAARRDAGPLSSVSRSAALARGEHLVDDAVLLGLSSREDVVAVDVAVQLLDGLTGVVRHGLFQPRAHAQDLSGLDLDVGRLAL